MQKCTVTYSKTTCGYIHCSLYACGNSGLGFLLCNPDNLPTHKHFYAYSHGALNGYFCISPHFIGLFYWLGMSYQVIYITCTMAAWDFADIYTRSPRACGPRGLGVYISKIPRSHGITITYLMELGSI